MRLSLPVQSRDFLSLTVKVMLVCSRILADSMDPLMRHRPLSFDVRYKNPSPVSVIFFPTGTWRFAEPVCILTIWIRNTCIYLKLSMIIEQNKYIIIYIYISNNWNIYCTSFFLTSCFLENLVQRKHNPIIIYTIASLLKFKHEKSFHDKIY